jgi:hypothetical protein
MQTAGLNEALLLEEQELLPASIGEIFIGSYAFCKQVLIYKFY